MDFLRIFFVFVNNGPYRRKISKRCSPYKSHLTGFKISGKLSAAICRGNVLKLLLHRVPYLRKQKILLKNRPPNFYFENLKKQNKTKQKKKKTTAGRMAQGKQELKFERKPCIRFRDNCDTDGRTTYDRRISISRALLA